jgi:hypothetical protein
VRFDAQSGECLVFTFREGLLSAVGHDLELRVERFAVDVADDRSAVEARFDAASLRVVGVMRGGQLDPGLLPARERREIEETIVERVLVPARWPEIVFRSSSVRAGRIEGQLTLCGRAWPIACALEAQGGRTVATAVVHQPDFGITPFTAMLGTLRIKPDVRVRLALPL